MAMTVEYKKFEDLNLVLNWTSVKHNFVGKVFENVCISPPPTTIQPLTQQTQKIMNTVWGVVKLINDLCKHKSFRKVKKYLWPTLETQVKASIVYDDILNNLHKRDNIILNFAFEKQKNVMFEYYEEKLEWLLGQKCINVVQKTYNDKYTITILQDDENNFWFDINEIISIIQVYENIEEIVSDNPRCRYNWCFDKIIINEYLLYYILYINQTTCQKFIQFIYTEVLPSVRSPLQQKQQHCTICLKILGVSKCEIALEYYTAKDLKLKRDWSGCLPKKFHYYDIKHWERDCYNSELQEDFDSLLCNANKIIDNIHWIFTTTKFAFPLNFLKEKLELSLHNAIFYEHVFNTRKQRANCTLNYLINSFFTYDSYAYRTLQRNLYNLPQYRYVDYYLKKNDFELIESFTADDTVFLDVLFIKYLIKPYKAQDFIGKTWYEKLLEYNLKQTNIKDVLYSLKDENFNIFDKIYDDTYYYGPKIKIVKFIAILKQNVRKIEEWWIRQMYKPNSTYVKNTLQTRFNERREKMSVYKRCETANT